MNCFTFWTICLCLIRFNSPSIRPLHDYYDISAYEDEALDQLNGGARESEDGSSSTSSINLPRKQRRLISQPQKLQLTPHMEATLETMENYLKTNAEFPYRWEEFTKYPTPDHQKCWNNHCRQIWPGTSGYEGSQRLCVGKLYPVANEQGGARYKIYFHTTKEFNEQDPCFEADIVRCECRYMKPTPGKTLRRSSIKNTKTYFFSMKYTDNVYFLLKNLPGKKNSHLRIASYAEITPNKIT